MERPEVRVYRDLERGRRLPLCLYRGPSGSPLVLLSPGFGGAYTDYAGLARGWQAGGYTVAVLEHPGSARLQALSLLPLRLLRSPLELRRRAHAPQERWDRCLDAVYLWERLLAELRPPSLGLAGHSLGSATALALAGLDSRWGVGRLCIGGVVAFSPHPPGWLFEPEDYRRLSCPCLMVVGTRDRPVAARLEAARACEAQLEVVAGAGHMTWAGWGWGVGPHLEQARQLSLAFWDRTL